MSEELFYDLLGEMMERLRNAAIKAMDEEMLNVLRRPDYWVDWDV